MPAGPQTKGVPHVLGCRDTAARLSRKYGADETDAARAGLLHDVTKALRPGLTASTVSKGIRRWVGHVQPG